MAKKLFSDAVFKSPTNALSTLNEIAENIESIFAIDALDIIRDNLPTVADEQGNNFVAYGRDPETNAIVFDDAAVPQLGTLAIVTIYEGEHRPDPQSEPLAIPVAVYLLNLPKQSEIMSDGKLTAYRESLIARDLLSRARKLAKADYAGKAPIVRDRIGALLAAATRTGGSLEKAYDALFPVIQGVLLKNVAAKVAALREAKQIAQARLVNDTFSKARLNKDTLKECLSSVAAAKHHFPAMPQSQWENLLKVAIAWAPKHQVLKLVKDAAGNNLKEIDPETGKERAVREAHAAPQSPAIFQQWLDTRAETERPITDDFTLSLDDLTVDAA